MPLRCALLMLVTWGNFPTAMAAELNLLPSLAILPCGDEPDGVPAVVTGVAFAPDNATVAAACDDHRVRVWDVATGRLKFCCDGHRDWIRAIAWSPSGEYLVTAGNDRIAMVWDAASGARIAATEPEPGGMSAIAIDPAGEKFTTVGFQSQLHVYELPTAALITRLDCPCRDLRAVATAPSGGMLAVAGRNGVVRLWNVGSGEFRDLQTGPRKILCLAFSPEGGLLAAAGEGRQVHLFQTTDGERLSTLTSPPCATRCLLFADASTLLTGSTDNVIRLWDVRRGLVQFELHGHTGTISSLAATTDGQRLASGSFDTTVRLWDLAAAARHRAARRSVTDQPDIAANPR